MDNRVKTINWQSLFSLFLMLHIITWSVLPFCLRYTLPMDAIEGAIWGHQLQWGYDKNPFLNAWLTALALHLSGRSGWTLYLFSQLAVGLCFWSVWQLAKRMMPCAYAFLAVIILEGIQYFNFHTIDFNDNTLELGLWGLGTFYFYLAVKNQTRRAWWLTGLFLGLSMLAKYFTLMLIIPMLFFLLSNRANRQNFRHPHLYAAVAIFSLLLLPHLLWLTRHDFISVKYAFARVHAPTISWLNHISYSAQFIWDQCAAFLPCLLLGLVLYSGKHEGAEEPRFQLSRFDKTFLIYLGIGPFLLTIFLSLLTGMTLRSGWGQPLQSLWGIILIATLKPQLSLSSLKRFANVYIGLFSLVILGYSLAVSRAAEPSSANFPGKTIAATLTREWHRAYHTPLNYVAGSRWIAGNIALYSKDRPAVYLDCDVKHSPWIDEVKLRRRGAIFVWDNTLEDTKKIAETFLHYPHLLPMQVRHFAWLRNHQMEPVEIGVAFLPPENVNSF